LTFEYGERMVYEYGYIRNHLVELLKHHFFASAV